MVEPIKPILRHALIEEHEGLTEEIIDRLEELTHQRFEIDPDEQPDLLKQIDQEREQLLQQHMPHFKEVSDRVEKEESSE
jgi:hypothetical protein